MTMNRKVTGTAVAIPVGVGMGVIVGIVLTLTLGAAETWLLLTGRVEASLTGYLSMGVLAISSFAGAMLSAAKTKRRRVLVCLLCSGIYISLLLLSTVLFFGGNYQGVLTGFAVSMISGSVAGLLQMRIEKRGDKKYRRYHSC